jgi:hypothetical protein
MLAFFRQMLPRQSRILRTVGSIYLIPYPMDYAHKYIYRETQFAH